MSLQNSVSAARAGTGRDPQIIDRLVGAIYPARSTIQDALASGTATGEVAVWHSPLRHGPAIRLMLGAALVIGRPIPGGAT
jgi:hypothetical protein